MFPQPESPWLFKRDNFDLLEEEYDAILDRHEKVTEPQVRELEESVLQEQIETEDSIESELALLINQGQISHQPIHEETKPTDDRSLREILLHDQKLHPLLEQSIIWANQTHRLAFFIYQQTNYQSRDAFRITANVFLIPMKLDHAFSEQKYQDEQTSIIAEKELELALVYLERILISFAELRKRKFISKNNQKLIDSAKKIYQEISAFKNRLSAQNKYKNF